MDNAKPGRMFSLVLRQLCASAGLLFTLPLLVLPLLDLKDRMEYYWLLIPLALAVIAIVLDIKESPYMDWLPFWGLASVLLLFINFMIPVIP